MAKESKQQPTTAVPTGQPRTLESPDDLLSTKEAARLLNVSPKTVQRLCLAGKISYITVTPTLFRIRRSALSYFLSKREIKAAA